MDIVYLSYKSRIKLSSLKTKVTGVRCQIISAHTSRGSQARVR